MVRTRTASLLLGEWAVLGVLAAGRAHGFAVWKRLAPSGDIGRVWSLSRPLTYRAIAQLEERALVKPVGEEPGTAGGDRTIYAATPAGRRALRKWLGQPAVHLRDVRSELLLKLVLCDVTGVDRAPLLAAQRQAVGQVAELLASSANEEPTDVVALWRHESSQAILRFLDRVDV